MKLIRTVGFTTEIVGADEEDTFLSNDLNNILEELQTKYKESFKLIDIKYSIATQFPTTIEIDSKFIDESSLKYEQLRAMNDMSIQGCLVIYECDTKYDETEE